MSWSFSLSLTATESGACQATSPQGHKRVGVAQSKLMEALGTRREGREASNLAMHVIATSSVPARNSESSRVDSATFVGS